MDTVTISQEELDALDERDRLYSKLRYVREELRELEAEEDRIIVRLAEIDGD